MTEQPTTKLIRVPAETWRAVVEALIESERLLSLAATTRNDYDASIGSATCWKALEQARKVKP